MTQWHQGLPQEWRCSCMPTSIFSLQTRRKVVGSGERWVGRSLRVYGQGIEPRMCSSAGDRVYQYQIHITSSMLCPSAGSRQPSRPPRATSNQSWPPSNAPSSVGRVYDLRRPLSVWVYCCSFHHRLPVIPRCPCYTGHSPLYTSNSEPGSE